MCSYENFSLSLIYIFDSYINTMPNGMPFRDGFVLESTMMSMFGLVVVFKNNVWFLKIQFVKSNYIIHAQ